MPVTHEGAGLLHRVARTLWSMELLAGPAQVTCPTCLARVGRACTVRRGYLYEGGFHARRREVWLELEDRETHQARLVRT